MNMLTYIKVKEFLQKHGFAICILCGILVTVLYGISVVYTSIYVADGIQEAGGLRTIVIDIGREILSIIEEIKE